MNSKFTVIESTDEDKLQEKNRTNRIVRLNKLWERQYRNSVLQLAQKKDAIFTVCGCLTLRNFVITFPIDKTYDGDKWECKDYFYTMDVLSKMDWDKPIGRDELSELLWDYENADLRHAYVEFTTAMSAIYRVQTGKGIAEKFFEDRGVPVYTMDKETGIMKNNQTGDIIKLKKVSHLQIVK